MSDDGLWTLYTSPKGRISRRTFWMRVVLPFMAVSLIVTAVETGLQTGLGMDYSAGPLTLLWGILAIWPLLATSVKRVHDMGRPGWDYIRWLVAGVVLVLFTVLLTMAMHTDPLFDAGLAVVVIIIVIALIIWGLRITFRRGTEGPNEYGPDPLG